MLSEIYIRIRAMYDFFEVAAHGKWVFFRSRVAAWRSPRWGRPWLCVRVESPCAWVATFPRHLHLPQQSLHILPSLLLPRRINHNIICCSERRATTILHCLKQLLCFIVVPRLTVRIYERIPCDSSFTNNPIIMHSIYSTRCAAIPIQWLNIQ